MAQDLQLIVHGRGNAWPVFLGQTHPFYDRNSCRDLANASYSLVRYDGEGIAAGILVDAGHGTVQSLLSEMNRIPECICLTHGHMDHVLSVDWVVQSFRKQHGNEARYPVYATEPVSRALLRSHPQLSGQIEFGELEPAGRKILKEATGFSVTSYPVYHGPTAYGASMLLFEVSGKRVLFTGDVLVPLLRHKDYQALKGVDLVVVDTNNRYPWPGANHWSFAGHPESAEGDSDALREFRDTIDYRTATEPQERESEGEATRLYFEELRDEWPGPGQPFTILEFLRLTDPEQVAIVHYSGMEDLTHYGQPLLSGKELQEWIDRTASDAGITARFTVPSAGQRIPV